MDVFWEKGKPQLVCTVTQDSEVLGYVVIDSTVGGRSCGGLRMLPDVDEEEVRGLARAMTLKYGFLGLPRGGAKAGVRGDPEGPQDERRRRLAEFGQAISPLLRSRTYSPGTDMGTHNDDIRSVLQAAGVCAKRRELRGTQSGYYTALTVFACAREAMHYLGQDLAGRTVAIEGFGKVGSALGGLLAAADARVVAVSTSRGAIRDWKGLDVDQLLKLVGQEQSRFVESYAGAERIDPAALLELPVDILCPCARHNSLHQSNVHRVQARVVCPGANNPVAAGAERILFERGVLCLPDFVTNCGGVLGGAMEFASVSRERIASFIESNISARIASLLAEAARRGVLPREIAVPLALGRFERMRLNAAHPTPLGRLFEFALELYRRGWVPSPLVGAVAPVYFRRSLA